MADIIKRERNVPQSPYDAEVQPFVDPPKEQSEIVTQYLHMLRKRKMLVLAVVVTVVALAALQSYTVTPTYSSTARIQIDTEPPNILPYQEIGAAAAYYIDPEPYLQTQYRLLQSRALGIRVVRKLKLTQNPVFSAPRSPGILRELGPGTVFRMLAAIRGTNKRDPQENKGIPKPPTPAELEAVEKGYADAVVGGVTVEPDRGTRLVSITYTSHNPELAEKIVNTLVVEYIDMSFKTRYDAAMMAHDFLQQELEELRIKVEKADEALLAYAQRHGIVDVSERSQNIVMDKLFSLNTEIGRIEAELVEKSVQNELANRATVDNFPQTLKTEKINALESRLLELRQKLANQMSKFGPDWPEVLQTKREMFEVDGQLRTERRNAIDIVHAEYEQIREHFDKVRAAFEEQKLLANQLNSDSIQFNILRREADTNKQLYEGLLQRLKEAGVSAGMQSGNIHIVEFGERPRDRSYPQRQKDLLFGLMAGLVLGIGLAFVIDYFDNSIKTPEDLERYTGLVALGAIPRIKQDATMAQTRDAKLIPHLSQKSLVSESYRTLRTSILLSHSGNPPRTILVTSALPGEGKTTTATNTAIVLAQTGAPTLLLDLDMRKPEIEYLFGGRRRAGRGMSVYLSGNSDFVSQVCETTIPNLYLVTSGPTPPNPVEMCSSVRWERAVRLASSHFQHVVVDSPPVLSVADPLVLATKVDGVILVVRAGHTPRDAVRRAKNALYSVGAEILGVAINDIDLDDSRYSYYYRYYYGSTYYGYGTDSSGQARIPSRN